MFRYWKYSVTIFLLERSNIINNYNLNYTYIINYNLNYNNELQMFFKRSKVNLQAENDLDWSIRNNTFRLISLSD